MMGKHFTSFILAICVVLISLYASIFFWANNQSFFEKQFVKNDTANYIGMSFDDLLLVNQRIIDYMFGRVDSIDVVAPSFREENFFNEKEAHHMVDVRGLFTKGFYLFLGCIIATVGIVFYHYKKKNLRDVLKSSSKFVCGLIAFFALLGIIISTNFNKYFTLFHEMFFNNDLWLLDPNVDMMINMYPLNFFITMSLNIILTFIFINIIYVSSIFFWAKRNNR